MTTDTETANPYETEMPEPPSSESGVVEVEAIDAALFDDVPQMGEVFPIGTYEFRLRGWSKSDKEPTDETKQKDPEEARFGAQPQFQINWVATTEPHTGRMFVDFVTWPGKNILQAAAKGDETAKGMVRKRLIKAKAIMEAAGKKAVGSMNFEEFLNTQPEVKIQLSQSEGKSRIGGKLVPKGRMNNNAEKYLPLLGPPR